MLSQFLHPLLGGLMIGTAALLLYAFSGRIAGISGIAYGLIWQRDRLWRALFIAALIAGGAVMAGLGFAVEEKGFGQGRVPLLIVAGLLVGFGTRLGNGCTSGHGVCGLARFSWRSLAAVATFMAVGAVVATGALTWLK